MYILSEDMQFMQDSYKKEWNKGLIEEVLADSIYIVKLKEENVV